MTRGENVSSFNSGHQTNVHVALYLYTGVCSNRYCSCQTIYVCVDLDIYATVKCTTATKVHAFKWIESAINKYIYKIDRNK